MIALSSKGSYDRKDRYFKAAKDQGFVARSAFKLEEIDRRWKFFKTGDWILDLGCAPGSWLQYAAKKIGPTGKALGIDLDPVRVNLPGVTTWQGDLRELTEDSGKLLLFLGEHKQFDVIQSDAMSKTTGVAETDCARSIDLVMVGINIAKQGLLKKGGKFVAKVFEGPGFQEFVKDFRVLFDKTDFSKPEAVRKGSREVYVIGLGFKSLPPKG